MSTFRIQFFGACITLVAALQGCANMDAEKKGASAPMNLNDSAWTLAALAGATLPPTPVPTLSFEGGRALGSDGCNRYGTSYTAADGKLQLGPQRMATQMACDEPASRVAAAFNRVLDEVRGYRVEAGSLLLLNAAGATLATLAPQPRTLAGTAWQVTGYNNGKQAVTSVIIGTQLTLEFMADGTLRGSGGCNNFNGRYSAEGSQMSIGRVASTRMACESPEGRMAQEALYLAALESTASARREGDRLELRTASGALAVSARSATPAKP